MQARAARATCTPRDRESAAERRAIRCLGASASVRRYAPCERRILFAAQAEHEANQGAACHETELDASPRPRLAFKRSFEPDFLMPLRAVKPQHETRTRILDAAEELFMQHGFEATSMRVLTNKAGVNLAAVNYHFGSKHALIEAVFRRRLDPMNAARIAALEELEASGRTGDAEAIIR